MLPRALVSFAFFLSGAAGLIFQVVWFYRCGLVFGNSVWAVAVVLSSFMCGLAAGGALAAGYAAGGARRLLRTYAALEIVVALSGVLIAALLPELSPLLSPVYTQLANHPILTNAVRLVVAFVALVVPSTAMGATLPILVGANVRENMDEASADATFGRALGRLYGWNTLGAMAGVLGAEFLLIDRLGITRTAWTAAALNGCAALVAFWLSRRASNSVPNEATQHVHATRRPAEQAPHRALLLSCAFLAGGSLLTLEVVWFRFLSMYVLSTTLTVSLMLAVVLASIGLGGLIGAAWLRWKPAAARQLPLVAIAAGGVVTLSYVSFQQTTGIQVGEWYRVLWLACVLSLPASLLSGVLFTLTGEALREDGDAVGTAAALVVANTVGAMIGPLVATFVLLPVMGMEGSFAVITIAYGAIAVLARLALRSSSMGRAARVPIGALAAAAATAAIVLAFPFGLMRDNYFVRVAQAYAADGSRIVATREGPSETIFLMRQSWIGERVYDRLVTNGFSMSGTEVPGLRYMRYFAYWPMLLHEGPLRRALVVCFGVGTTLDAVTQIRSVESIDVVEISADVLATSDLIYPSGQHPLRDPRVRTHVEDGRFFLQTTADRFDLITGEPPPPRTPGAETLYTREYFGLIHDHLEDGGIATYWLPVARPEPGTDVDTIIRAFCDVFEDCSLWNATPFDLMLVGTRGSSGPIPEPAFSSPWKDPSLGPRLREIGFEQPEQIGATFLGDAGYLRRLTANVPPLTDDFPHRLRPIRGRPTLSDPRRPGGSETSARYQDVIDPGRARDAFLGSDFIRRRWPPSLIERTLPFFEHQRTINRVFWEGGKPLRQIEDLHAVITQSTLRTLPLWLLGTDDVKQQIAARVDDGSGGVAYARGLSALAARDTRQAAAWFAEADRRGLASPNVRALRTYALCAAGQLDEARRQAAAARADEADERHFWAWIGPVCGAGPLQSVGR